MQVLKVSVLLINTDPIVSLADDPFFSPLVKGNWKDMSRVYLVTCAPGSASQQWDVMADGRIALVASKPQECLDLQYMRATQNNPVGLYSCAGLGGIGAADNGLNWPLVNATG